MKREEEVINEKIDDYIPTLVKQKGQKIKKEDSVKKDFKMLAKIFETEKSSSIFNKELGEIIVDLGKVGKSGYGLKHIIEKRKEDKKDTKEITALCQLIIEAAKNGKSTRINNRITEVEVKGIIAILRNENAERNNKWILTGFDNWNKQKEATDAIETVIANYSYSPEFSSFQKQVGAVITSLDKVSPNLDKKSSLKIKINRKKNNGVER